MPMLEYVDHLEGLRATHPALADELAPFGTLERLLPWLQRRGQDLAALDLITQDEFCHDLLVPLDRPNEWLSIGMT
jgi:hypothetical protein